MKRFFALLNLLLCFELIVGPLVPNLSLIAQPAYAEECSAGLSWDSTLNRCLTSVQTANIMNATANCGSDVECYKQNAINELQKEESAGNAPKRIDDKGGLISTVGNIAAIAGPVTMAAAGMGQTKSTCTSMSFWAMVGGSAALFVGDNLANMQHKSRLKKIKEDWGKIVNPDDVASDADKVRERNTESQSQAFEMLARSEESLAKAAKMKKTFFMVASLAYMASTAISVLEIIQENTPTPQGALARIKNTCKPLPPASGSSFEMKPIFNPKQFSYNLHQSQDIVSFIMNKQAMELTNSSPSIDDYYSLKESLKDSSVVQKSIFESFKDLSIALMSQMNPIQVSHAEESKDGVDTNAAKTYKEIEAKGSNPLITLGIGAAAGFAAGKLVGARIVTPTTRAVFSGVMAGWTMLMASHAGKQADASTKRAELLRKMKDEFASASGAINACGSSDRNDPAKPTCYCYTADNQRNSNRSSSKVCQSLWNGTNIAAAGNYTGDDGSGSSKICITNSNQADPNCACKATSTCMKVGASGITGINPGTFSMISTSLDPLNKIADGSASAANISAGSLDNQAARMGALVKKMEDSKNKNIAAYKKNKDKMADKLKGELVAASSQYSPNNLLGSSQSSGLPTNAGQAAAMLEKELEETNIGRVGGATDTLASPSSSEGQGLEFGLTNDQFAAQNSQVAEVMKENLDYGQNDINQGSKTNIFEVLSNRYQRSGMRRLFDEKGTTQADKAASSDIAQ